MPSADIINSIGITAYALILFLFLWIAQIPGRNKEGHYWFFAVSMILLARFNMQFLNGVIASEHIQSIYSTLLVFEKYGLIIGLLVHFRHKVSLLSYKKYGLYLCLSLSTVVFLFNSVLQKNIAFIYLFPASQAIALMYMAHLIYTEYKNTRTKILLIISVLLIVYSFHWLSFPIAISIPKWMALGFVIGNMFNVILYLFFVYLELYAFQHRLSKSEQDANELASKAVSANKAKSEFLANMSHELRTPMNGILGMISLLKRSKLDEKQKRQTDIAFESGQNLLVIINDILDFSKIEAGKLNIEYTLCNLKETFDSIIKLIKPELDKKNLSFELNYNFEETVLIKIDPNRMKQIITNLFNNAIKFTESGGVSISVELIGEKDKQQLHCHIRDTGIGIAEEKLSILFDAFQQEDGSTTRQYGGTGLGLSICKNLCELMGGRISVESKKGTGSCFSFWVSAPEPNKSERSLGAI